MSLDLPLCTRPSEQYLLRRDLVLISNLLDGLIDRSTRLARERDQGRVTFGYDIVLLHVFEERGLLGDNIWVQEDCKGEVNERFGGEGGRCSGGRTLVDDRLDFCGLQQCLEIVDSEAIL